MLYITLCYVRLHVYTKYVASWVWRQTLLNRSKFRKTERRPLQLWNHYTLPYLIKEPIVKKRNFKQWLSTIPPISLKRTITAKKNTPYNVGNIGLGFGQVQKYVKIWKNGNKCCQCFVTSVGHPWLIDAIYFLLVLILIYTEFDETLSDWLLLNTNPAIIQLYHSKNKLHFNEKMFSLY